MKPVEYEFVLQDGSKVYEIVCERSDVWAFQRMHNAKACKPVQRTQRVQIPAYTDRWMMGDRYGEIVKITKRWKHREDTPGKVDIFEVAHVKLDKSDKVVRVILADCEVI